MTEFTLDDSNLVEFASSIYITHGIYSKSEFNRDLDKIKYTEKLLDRWNRGTSVNIRLVINHLTILFNVFEESGCIRILLFRLNRHLDILIPVLTFLGKPPKSLPDHPDVDISDIPPNKEVVDVLRALKRPNKDMI